MSFLPPDPSTVQPWPSVRRSGRRRLRRVVAWGALASLAFGTGAVAKSAFVTSPASLPGTVQVGDAASGRDEMVAILSQRFYRPVDVSLLTSVAATDFGRVLDDPYTRFLTASDYERFMSEERAEAAGIGVDVVVRDPGLEITRVFADSPADHAGLRSGDLIVAVDDALLRGLPLSDALARLRGDGGTSATVAVQRSTGLTVLPVTRRRTGDWMVASAIRPAGDQLVGYLALLDFSEGAGAMARREVETLLAHGATSIVLDLRGNPGGWASEAVRVAEIFLPQGAPVLIERGEHIDTTTYVTHAAPVDSNVPLFVLVDGQTASSAEIVSGALRDNGRARLVGETTFGKGRIQDVVPLDTGGAFKFTIAEYLTPSGFALDGVGLTPDLAMSTGTLGGLDVAYFITAARIADARA
jgi:carboxyl-terminal processing protease